MKNTKAIFLVTALIMCCSCSNMIGVTVSEVTLPRAQNLTEERKNVLAEFKTNFNKKMANRTTNVKLASDAINGKIVNPGEVFSFNDAVGPTTKKTGYKKAMIFENKKKAMGYGGGICQVSSTLYNAALQAGLDIVELHHHSLPVHYVEDGMDATASYGSLDFKFQNNKSMPVKINSYMTDDTLIVELISI